MSHAEDCIGWLIKCHLDHTRKELEDRVKTKVITQDVADTLKKMLDDLLEITGVSPDHETDVLVETIRSGWHCKETWQKWFNETMPVFGRLLVDDLGYLWAQDFAPEWEPPPPWAVYDTTGVWLGTVHMPEGVTVGQVGRDFIVGAKWDELNVPSVGVWHLERGG